MCSNTFTMVWWYIQHTACHDQVIVIHCTCVPNTFMHMFDYIVCCCVDRKTGVKKTYFRCRRNKRGASSGTGRRSSKSTTFVNKGHVGCKCCARYIMEEKADGSVCVVFKALHNHDCQQEYLLHYLNPLDICPTLSDIVDTKLLAGVTDLTHIHSSMLKVTCNAFMTYSQ